MITKCLQTSTITTSFHIIPLYQPYLLMLPAHCTDIFITQNFIHSLQFTTTLELLESIDLQSGNVSWKKVHMENIYGNPTFQATRVWSCGNLLSGTFMNNWIKRSLSYSFIWCSKQEWSYSGTGVSRTPFGIWENSLFIQLFSCRTESKCKLLHMIEKNYEIYKGKIIWNILIPWCWNFGLPSWPTNIRPESIWIIILPRL